MKSSLPNKNRLEGFSGVFYPEEYGESVSFTALRSHFCCSEVVRRDTSLISNTTPSEGQLEIDCWEISKITIPNLQGGALPLLDSLGRAAVRKPF